MKSWYGLGVAALAMTGTLACGERGGTPTSPSTAGTTPFTAQFGGLYSGTMTLSGVAGGECVAVDLAATRGTVNHVTMAVTQERSDLTAVVRSATDGLQCTYEGNASFATFAVSSKSCDAERILFQCANGQSRVLELVGSTITGTIAGNTATATVATTYNVFADSTQTPSGTSVSGLTTQQQFTAVRQ